MQTALVSGGAGFIGSHLCKRLLQDGCKVICVDNLITGSKENVKDLLLIPQFKFIEQDIAKPIRQLPDQKSKVDYIFHLASPASPNKKSRRSYINYPIETLLANSVGTYNLLELAKKKSARFLYASSSEVYGDPAISPQKEEYFGNVNPVGVRSVYDEGKRFGEAITMAYVRKHNLDARIVRIFNTYGPQMQRDDGRVVSNFINQAIANEQITIYGDGKQTRSFCYIDDMIEGILKAMLIEKVRGGVVNLGNPDERTILELTILIKKMANSQSKIVHEEASEDDPKRRKPDITKAKRILGWEPKLGLEEGLTKTIQYFQSI
ncbi:MAG: SDR family oxidoreductase [Candidatus Levybacteria bacterium]|nr:SDR family oxidoreductase [Candidatus Levybacteria bacterium]MBI2190178.1 SDR family oxidoreductase [Candidatus Levybacteria bacterium]MBI2622607.1 SDR family oxidoreductase [Candidatus Levybacteria bacterium]MBI3069858.1 SDR family oxidoreductase [Candidatus Levybacteria bacterium]MBI3093036.1 SDR family oxidoreductase [Candidatus Levybacteria bacterium]